MLDLLVRLTEGGSGTRLPPERQLAAQFGVSRNEIRKALARLELDGRLSREVGRGTFVRAPADAVASSDVDGLRDSTSPRNAMEARLVLEPELASLAAVNATFKQIESMRVLALQMREAETWKDYELFDGRLHRLIADATANGLLSAIHRTVDDVRRIVVWRWLDTRPTRPPSDYSSFAEHDAIIDAIEQRNRTLAMETMRRHLRTTMDRLMGTHP